MSRHVIIAVAIVVAGAGVLLAFIWATQRALIYFPTGDVPEPADIGLADVEPVSYETADGLRLNAWFFPVFGSPRGHTLLFFSGNAGNRRHRTPLALALRRHGIQVLLVDYRGYGGNPGTPSESGLAADSRAARAYLLGRSDVDASRLVYFGESLGTAVAVDLAAEHPPAALILRSPFTSLTDLGQYHYPFLPVRFLLRDRFSSIDRIGHVRAPLLVIAGDDDRIVPIDNTRRLFEAARDPKTLVVVPGTDHNHYELLAGDEMMRAVVSLLSISPR